MFQCYIVAAAPRLVRDAVGLPGVVIRIVNASNNSNFSPLFHSVLFHLLSACFSWANLFVCAARSFVFDRENTPKIIHWVLNVWDETMTGSYGGVWNLNKIIQTPKCTLSSSERWICSMIFEYFIFSTFELLRKAKNRNKRRESRGEKEWQWMWSPFESCASLYLSPFALHIHRVVAEFLFTISIATIVIQLHGNVRCFSVCSVAATEKFMFLTAIEFSRKFSALYFLSASLPEFGRSGQAFRMRFCTKKEKTKCLQRSVFRSSVAGTALCLSFKIGLVRLDFLFDATDISFILYWRWAQELCICFSHTMKQLLRSFCTAIWNNSRISGFSTGHDESSNWDMNCAVSARMPLRPSNAVFSYFHRSIENYDPNYSDDSRKTVRLAGIISFHVSSAVRCDISMNICFSINWYKRSAVLVKYAVDNRQRKQNRNGKTRHKAE